MAGLMPCMDVNRKLEIKTVRIDDEIQETSIAKVGTHVNLWKCRKVTEYGNSFPVLKGDGFRGNMVWGFSPLGQISIALRDSFKDLKPLNTLTTLGNVGRTRVSGFKGDPLRVTR